jgi:ribonuclease R
MPVIDRTALLSLLASAPDVEHALGDLASALGVTRAERPALRELLLDLVRQGEVLRTGQHYRLAPEHAPASFSAAPSCGLLRVHPHGRGFVDLGEAYDEVLIAPDDQGTAIDGDTVEIDVWAGDKRREGRVRRVVSRGRTRLTGTLRGGQLEPDDPRLRLPVEVIDPGPAPRRPQTVLAAIEGYPARRGQALRVRVVRLLGEAGQLKTEVARAVAGAGVDDEFPPEVARAAESTPIAIRPDELADRLDLRALHFVTIDPLTARDFDDAVAVEEGPAETTRLWVAVADVSGYVAEGTPLDLEARRRGCSLYLPDRAIPMLPAALSSGVCSLVPDEDRLAMVTRLDIARDGRVESSSCAAAVIHSHGRLDYGSVAAALRGDFRGRRAGYVDHVAQLESLQQVADALRRRRLAAGALDLDLPEAQVVLDEDDPTRVRDIVESRPDTPIKHAYNLIEELMIAANEAVGRFLRDAGRETIWRVHAPPAAAALERLAIVLSSYGLPTRGDELSPPGALARVLKRLAGHRAARSLSYLVLRALAQASYGTTNVGHFGLASDCYLHFTSPIRRYPDLHVHRLVKDLLRQRGEPCGGAPPTQQVELGALQAIAREATAAERRTIEVEREVVSLYAASLMRDRIGEEHEATITGLTSFGFFAALDEPCVEGLVRSDRLSDWLELDSERMRLCGRRSGVVYSLGDRVRVRVVDATVARRQVDLELLGVTQSDAELQHAGHRRREQRGERGRKTRRRR